jgi:ribosome-binding factor A
MKSTGMLHTVLSLALAVSVTNAFAPSQLGCFRSIHKIGLEPLYANYGRSSPISGKDRSKRQERVGHLVRTEIANILQLGYPIKNQNGYIDEELRRRINVVSADVSPDLRQARITVSIIKPTKTVATNDDTEYDEEEEDEFDVDDAEEDEFDESDEELIMPKQVFPVSQSGSAAIDRRRAYSWLVKNTKQIRHAMSQRLSHMKGIPDLTFVQADVGAAVDVMKLIEKVSKGGYKRESIGTFGGDDDNLPNNMYLEGDLVDDDEWIDDEYEWEDDEENDEEGVSNKV